MTNRQKKLIEHLKNFIKICKENDIFYIAAGSTLLGAVNKKGLLTGEQKIEVNMTIDSYNKLKKVAINNLIDGSMDSSYPEINPKFLPDKVAFDETNIFIDILIIVPTTLKKVKKWRGILHKNDFFFKKIHSNYIPFNTNEKIMKFISYPFKNAYKQLTYKTAYNKLYSNKTEGLYTIHKPKCKAYKHWIPHLTFNVKQILFEDLMIDIPHEWATVLSVKYGKKYRSITSKKVSFEYINSVSTRKISNKPIEKKGEKNSSN